MWRKLPGCDAVRYVYDKADRLIFVQDGNLKGQGRWRFTIPDALGRTVLSGLCSEPLPVDGSAVEAEFTGSGSYKGYAVKVGGTVRALSGSRLLTVNYYDNYDFLGKNGFPAYAYDSSMESSGYGTKSDARGMLTGSVTGLAGDGAGQLYSVVYYDRRSRPVQRQGSNSLGGKETEYTAYNFTGQPTRLRHVHTAQGKAARTEVRTYSYDHAGRLLTVKHKLDALGEVTLVNNVYDDLGRLQSKSLHGSAVNKQTYTYNIRGWLTGVSGSKFTQNLYYNTGNGVAKYNGSISSMTWKAGNESTVRGYKFTYDGLDRLLNAIYGETAGISTNANRFSENVTNYDKNGNIKGLQRYGQTGASAYGLIDNLTFTLNGNRLNRVDDAVTASTYGGGFEFKDGVKQANEYAYDANGNLTKDLNKGITGISYNCLNLPNAVTFSDGSTITYTYGADGTKLRTVHKIGSATTTTDYCGNVIYENGVQKLLLTEEGYVTLSDSKYHYYLKDHQGNNRVVINQSGTVEETNHYYPFGGVFASAGSIQPYKYNGKEFDNKKGLNWYDYGARHYDAALGRFTTNDRFAEKYYSMSPYQYGANNPVNNIDVNGDTIVVNPNPNGLIDNVRMFFGFDTKYQKDVKADLQQLKKDDKEIGEMIIELEKSKNVHSITRTKRGKSNSSGFDREKAKKDIPQGSIINYDPDVKTDINGNHRTPRIGLSHELQHSSDVDKGIMSYENIGNGIPMREIRAINTENKIRKRTGDAKRTEYRGRKIPQKLLE
ncbi:RHS repeat-associated core domain-containing protein [Bacteroides uniformis]|uniref:RHS repeat-associated core domain-containing protein n=4 Tax=Bacteroides TaxID=816 RepID=UPI001EE0B8C7|nr:RHS repeat-associated core domain-containing protein [Bacteroides uniformis]MCG5042011.1 RHS repeat-associated core domain-containing protein [Bacteroides uniformis]